MDVLATRRHAVEAELAAAAGDVSLCTISRSGGPVDGVKHLEGRLAALAQVERAIRGGGRPDADVLRAALAEWREALDDVRSRDAGRGWVAYRAGGVDELAEALSDVGTPDVSP